MGFVPYKPTIIGIPPILSISMGFFPYNQPLLGYPHDYGNPQMVLSSFASLMVIFSSPSLHGAVQEFGVQQVPLGPIRILLS